MTALLHCSIGNINLFSGTTLIQRKRIQLANYNALDNNTKRVLYTRGYLFSRQSLQVPHVYRISLTPKHGLRSKIIAAVGTDLTVDDPNPAISGEVNVVTERASPSLAERNEIAPPYPAVTPMVKGKRPRSARKSEMPSVRDEQLIPGASFIGKVRSIQPFGAFVDFGAFTDGLVHVSRISDEYVKDVATVVSIGQEVKVKIVEANKEIGRISLTMRNGDDANKTQLRKEAPTGESSDKPRTGRKNAARSKQKDGQKSTKLVMGQALDGTVKNVTRSGSFVSLPDGEEGFVPVSEESEGFGNVLGNSSLHVGQEIKVRVLRISRGQVTLTMKKEEDIDAINRQLNQGVVHVATNPFELAFRQNKDIAAFLDEREKMQKKTSLVIEEKVDRPTLDSDSTSKAISDIQIGNDAELVSDSPQDEISISKISTKDEFSGSDGLEDSVSLGVTKEERFSTSKALVLEKNESSLSPPFIKSENGEVSIPESSIVGDTTSIDEEKERDVSDQSAPEDEFKLLSIKENENEEFSNDVSLVAEGDLITNETEVTTSGNLITDELKENEVPDLTVSHKKESFKSSTSEEGQYIEVSYPLNSTTYQVLATDEDKESKVPDITFSESIASSGNYGAVENEVEPAKLEESSEKDGGKMVASEVAYDEVAKTESDVKINGQVDKEETPLIENEIPFSNSNDINIKASTLDTSIGHYGNPDKGGTIKAAVSSSVVKQLREETGAGMMDCKKALVETDGDIVKAREFLRKKGLASADRKASRTTAEGRIGSYIHDNRIGVLVEVNCETDFVSRGEIFQQLVDDLAMQVAACSQVQYLVPEDVPDEIVNKEKEIEMQKEDLLMKPEQIRSKIVDGRIKKRLADFALLEQPYIKNDKMIVKDWVKQTIATVGENIKVKRFVRFNLGEGLEKKSQDFAAEVAAQTAAKSSPSVPKDQSPENEIVEKPPTATISAALVKQLREETGAGMMDCKKALLETNGNLEKAQEYLRKKGLSSADKKSSRLAAEGRISSYIHDSRIGCLIEVNSETDFVGRNEKFMELVDDLAMQVVACPQVEFVSVEDVPESKVNEEMEIEMQREDLQSKPENIRQKIVEGRISKRLGELVLLEQPFIKDDSLLVKDLVKQTAAALGENIKVRRFVRFTLGEIQD